MNTSDNLKEIVKQKYSQIALQSDESASCCGGSCNDTGEVTSIMADDYRQLEGYQPDADLGLGCGLPTQFAMIKPGNTVIDLGSGAGNDCFVARHETGETGKVIGIDFSEPMIQKARINAEKLGFNNVEFRYGDIEQMPVSDNLAHVIVSNCVLNLVPNKPNVFADIYRVLTPGGHFSISDIVLQGSLPEALRKDAEMYAGCVAGAIPKDEYLQLIHDTGFTNVVVQKEKVIQLPEETLSKHLNTEELHAFHTGEIGIYSITVYAEKPSN